MTTNETKFETGTEYRLYTKSGWLFGTVIKRTAATVTFKLTERGTNKLGTDTATLRVTWYRDGAEAAAGTAKGNKYGYARNTKLEAYASETA